jgi:uncharacterized membrane protein
LSPARLEAFSDGVIAVIITILVLELKVPAQDGWAGVRVVLPTIFLYLLTFLQVGIYWVNHHYLVDEVESVSHGILWANLIFLFFLSLFPFVTLWVGSKGLSPFSAALYAAASLLPGVCYSVLSTQVRRQSKSPPHSSAVKQISSIALYLLAVPVACYSPAASLALICVVALIWLLPPKVEAAAEGEICTSAKDSRTPQAEKR